jgi:predicted amidohydrolase
MFKLALVQMRVKGGRREENLRRAAQRIGEAAVAGAKIIVLPEALDLGWTHPSARTEAEPIPNGAACLTLREAARRNGVSVCAGLTERAGEAVFNSAVLIDPSGTVLLAHRKLNELEIGLDLYGQGDRLAVARTPLGTVGVMVCADAFARGQVISRTLGLMGADVIVSPCAWAVPANHDNTREPYGQLWLDNYCPVARDFRLWIVGVSNVGWLTDGPWQGRRCIGCSLVVNPDGAAVVRGPYGVDAEALLYTDIQIEPRPARGDAWEDHWRQRAGDQKPQHRGVAPAAVPDHHTLP